MVSLVACWLAGVFSGGLSTGVGADALNGSDPYGVGAPLTFTLKFHADTPVYITPIYTVNHLKGSILLESVLPIFTSRGSRLLGQYQLGGCDDQPSFIFAKAQDKNDRIVPARPFWLHREYLPWSKCNEYRYWADRIEFSRTGVATIPGYVATYRYRGVTYHDTVNDVDFKFIIVPRGTYH